MSVNTATATRVFGGIADQAGRVPGNPSTQLLGEVATTAGTGLTQRVRGPRAGGHFSFHLGVTEASAGGGLTVWYSNLPDPDPAVDAHWVQDTTIGTVATTAVATLFNNVGNVSAEWIRYKVLPTGDTASVWLYHLGENRNA